MQVGQGALPRLHAAGWLPRAAADAAVTVACPAADGDAEPGRMEAGDHRRGRTLLRHLPDRLDLSFQGRAVSAGPPERRRRRRNAARTRCGSIWSAGIFYSGRASMMLDRYQRRSAMVHRQDLEQHMDHRRVGLVEHGVIDVTGLEKEISGAVDDCLV